MDIKFGCMPMQQDCVGGFGLIMDERMAKEGLPEIVFLFEFIFVLSFCQYMKEKVYNRKLQDLIFCFNQI